MFYNQIGYEPDGIRLVVDLDSTTVLTDADQRSLVEHLERTLASFYTDYVAHPIPVFTACCGPRFKKGQLSLAMHMIAHVTVTIEQAKQLLYSYRLRLEREGFSALASLDIDASIYKEKAQMLSLRMIYSHKVDDCPLCKKDPAQQLGCTLCNQSGRVCSKQTYVPRIYSCGRGPEPQEVFVTKHPSFQQIVLDYSVWSLEPSERRIDYVRPLEEPSYQTDEVKLTKTGKVKKVASASSAGTVPLAENNRAYEMIEDLISKVVWLNRKPWEGIRVSRIDVKQNRAFVSVTNAGSTWCLYANKDHGSNRIYFTLDKQGVLTQQCYSDKDHGCKSKPRIVFSASALVVEKVFGIQAPPNPFGKTSRPKGKFDFCTFMKRRMEEETELDPGRKKQKQDALAKQQRIEALATFYNYSARPKKV
jgi:hypothetical protein